MRNPECGTKHEGENASADRSKRFALGIIRLYQYLQAAEETAYRLEFPHESGYIDEASFGSLYQDCEELIRLLAAITKTQNNEKQTDSDERKGEGVRERNSAFRIPNSELVWLN